jgi:hypothetical protein
MFNPQTEYDVYQDKIDIRDFHNYPENFVVRPPYQRKSVWGRARSRFSWLSLSAILHPTFSVARSVSQRDPPLPRGRCRATTDHYCPEILHQQAKVAAFPQ